jgi:hypothetical protein
MNNQITGNKLWATWQTCGLWELPECKGNPWTCYCFVQTMCCISSCSQLMLFWGCSFNMRRSMLLVNNPCCLCVSWGWHPFLFVTEEVVRSWQVLWGKGHQLKYSLCVWGVWGRGVFRGWCHSPTCSTLHKSNWASKYMSCHPSWTERILIMFACVSSSWNYER